MKILAAEKIANKVKEMVTLIAFTKTVWTRSFRPLDPCLNLGAHIIGVRVKRTIPTGTAAAVMTELACHKICSTAVGYAKFHAIQCNEPNNKTERQEPWYRFV